jgi:hypothetical protein
MSWNHMLRGALTIYIVIAICLAGTTMAATFYVDASVAATGDGSLASPFKTIGEAITASAMGDEIRIAGGTYDNEPPDMGIKGSQIITGSYDSTFTTSDRSATPTIIDMGRLGEQEQDRTFRCRGTTSFTLENLVIQNSTSGEFGDTDNGGAIYVQTGSSGVIRGVSFINCAAKFEGGVEAGPAREGGAVCIRDASTVTFEDCVFDSCTAVGGGGALRVRSAGSGNNVKLYRCLFTNCGARREGSVIDDGDSVSQIEIVNCIFANNGVDVVVPSGTAPSNYLIRVSDRRALIYNCTFVGNNNPAGYMFNVGDSGDASAAKEIINCIVANNTMASDGATFAIFNYATGYNDTTTLQNNLFFSNSGLDPLDPAGAGIIGASGNIAGDPQFADAANGDYHLKPGSPGEDAGQTLALVPDDFAGTMRPVGSAYDIGALEGQAPVSFKVPGVIATASSSLNANSGPERTVDGSGLNALDQHDTAAGTMWISAAGQEPPVWIQYEFDTVYKLDQMWVWNANNGLELLFGFGVKTATIEYSTDGVTWAALENVPEFAQAPGTDDYAYNTTVDFGGVAAKFVRITCISNWGGGSQYGLSEVRFFYFPVQAQNPSPGNGATGVPIDATLSWKAGRGAASHEIHLDTDMQAVADSTAPIATVSQPEYAPANLQLDTTYYWKVVEVNEAESPSAWASAVWSFSTSPYWVVDNFESYTNNSPNRVFQTWIDGLGFSADEFFPNGNDGNGSGAIIGYDPSAGNIMERTIVHGGRQSMPVSYDGPSEITRTFDTAQDWTRSGITTLVLFFQGDSTNVSGELYVKINGTKVPYSGNAADLAAAEWKQWNIDLPSAANLGSVKTLTIGVSSGQGMLYIDDIGLYRSAPAVNP